MKTNNAQAEIRTLVDSFVDQLTQHIRQAAVESVQQALGGSAPARATAPATGRKGAKPGPKPKAAKAKKTGKGGRRVRRSPEEMAAAKDAIVRYVNANPGTAMGDLSAALREDPTTIRTQVNELLEAKALRKEGERRGTRYFAGSGRGSKKATKRGKKATRKGKAAKRKTSKKKTARKSA
jgi:hypothetical protein